MVAVHRVERIGDWLFLHDDSTGRPKYVEVPPEVYFRQFRDTDVTDLDALAELCRLGRLTPLPDHDANEDLPSGNPRARLVRAMGYVWPNHELRPPPAWLGDEEERKAVANKVGSPGQPVHVLEVAVRVRAVQQCTLHMLAHLAGEPATPIWDTDDDHPTEVGAWHQFMDWVNAALRPFHVRVSVHIDHFDIGDGDPSLYQVAMLQLVTDLSAGETVHHCASETCGRPFIRQVGRAQYGGSRRVGTRYCSASCARAQYQREKRRRDRVSRGSDH